MTQDTVLFVDDETNILHAMKRLLRNEPYRILTASSGQEGLDILSQEPVHLIVSDQRMPEMPGNEFLQQVKLNYPDTVRVILSGYADVNVILDAVNKGEIYRFLTKPWNDEELKISLRQCLAHYHLLQENQLLMQKIQEQNLRLHSLNAALESEVEQRTHSLQLSQEILEKLPIAILGVTEDDTIALTNHQVRTMLSQKAHAILGRTIDEIFPHAIADWLRHVRQQDADTASDSFSSESVHLRYVPLSRGNASRGGIVILEGAC